MKTAGSARVNRPAEIEANRDVPAPLVVWDLRARESINGLFGSISISMGLGFFIFDYRGYGDSKGKITEAGTYLDAGAAYKWLCKERQIPEHRIVIFGRSLGASVAANLAGKVNCGGVVLENAFTSYAAMGQKMYPYMPVKWFAKFKYDTKEYLESVSCPILFFHSRDDEVVPYEFGRELFESVECDKRFVDIFGRHNNSFLMSLDIYKKGWVDFLGHLHGLHSKED